MMSRSGTNDDVLVLTKGDSPCTALCDAIRALLKEYLLLVT